MADMTLYKFTVKGENGEYEITFFQQGSFISAKCTCPAGENGLHCKHRIQIMKGSSLNVLSGNENQVEEIKSLIRGTDLEKALMEFEEAEVSYAAAQKRLARAKKSLAKAMM
jgi:uncharacterized Zn finger protein